MVLKFVILPILQGYIVNFRRLCFNTAKITLLVITLMYFRFFIFLLNLSGKLGIYGSVVSCRGGVSPPATNALISTSGRRNASPTDNHYPFALREANVLNPKFPRRSIPHFNRQFQFRAHFLGFSYKIQFKIT